MLETKETVPRKISPIIKRPQNINSISTLFENKEGYGLESIGSFGLGFRAAMPKMPSFRKIVSGFFLSTLIHALDSSADLCLIFKLFLKSEVKYIIFFIIPIYKVGKRT